MVDDSLVKQYQETDGVASPQSPQEKGIGLFVVGFLLLVIAALGFYFFDFRKTLPPQEAQKETLTFPEGESYAGGLIDEWRVEGNTVDAILYAANGDVRRAVFEVDAETQYLVARFDRSGAVPELVLEKSSLSAIETGGGISVYLRNFGAENPTYIADIIVYYENER